MAKIAIISDIHGNLTALEAVIADIKAKAVDEVWVLGDILMPGPGKTDLRITPFITANRIYPRQLG